MSLITNLISLLIIILGYFSPIYKDEILSVGFFALSGAITNWLAIHMLFEKVPFLYGSGIIPNRFLEFKEGIRHLIMGEFFNENNIKKFFAEMENKQVDLGPVIEKLNFHQFFDHLVEVVKESQFGGMLSMFGGVQALEPMREPFSMRMKMTILEFTSNQDFREALSSSLEDVDIQKKIDGIVNRRLDELTPQMVKTIIQEMIKKHLGWLVVWGGVFGGLLGFIMGVVRGL